MSCLEDIQEMRDRHAHYLSTGSSTLAAWVRLDIEDREDDLAAALFDMGLDGQAMVSRISRASDSRTP